MSTRQRTPSGLKWVANELFAIAGELERIDEQLAPLMARRARLELEREALNQVGAVMGVAELQAIAAAVRVHKAYGGRGFLADWVRETLKAAAPKPVDTRTLALLAQEHFKLDLPTPEARAQYRHNSLGRAVRKLLSLGQVERLHDPEGAQGPGLWRWKVDEPGAARLMADAATRESS